MIDLLPWSTSLLGWFAETTLVAGVLACVAHFGARVHRFPPAARHALWLVVLIKMMTPPLVHWPWSQLVADGCR